MSSREDVIHRHTNLDGSTALVTGGTKGIGRASVLELAALGAQVLTCSRKQEDIDDLLAEAKQKGWNVQGIVADLGSEEGRDGLIKKVGEILGGKLDILVNNVGTNLRCPTKDYKDEDFRRIMSTNLDSAFLVTKGLYGLLKASGNASIVVIGSVAGGPTTIHSGCPYAMTKAALDQFVRYTATEWAKDGIRVNSVKPGYIETPLTQALLADDHKLRMIKSRTPMRRVGQPQEIAGLVAFLASPAATYLTGACIPVDGGFSSMGMWPIDDVIPW